MEKLLNEPYDLYVSTDDPLLNHAIKITKENNEYSLYSTLWLLGERLPFGLRMKLGLGSNIDEDKSLKFIVALAKALLQEYRGVALYLDEFEAVLTLNRARRAAYFEALRTLIDILPSRTIFVTALTPACWEEIVNLNAALARRLSSFIIYLRSLRLDEVRLLLEHYIKASGSNVTVNDVFEEEVLNYLYEVSNGNPGEILRLASVLVDVLIFTERKDKIRIDDAKEVLSRYV